MVGPVREIKEIEMGRLELRYAHTRIQKVERVSSLIHSMERFGQVLPVIVLREATERLVLIDGYQRVKALERSGRDTVRAEEEALIEVLTRAQSRKWEFLEEAALLWELHHRYQLSQSRMASLLGRKQGWVSGRLVLYEALSEDLLESIRKGAISSWAATRIIAPIARAIPEHGKILLENLSKGSLSTREMVLWFRHYQKANRQQRDNLVRQPLLFLKALRAKEEAAEDQELKEGPEGQWLRECKRIVYLLRGLLKEVPTLFGSPSVDRRILLIPFEESQGLFIKLQNQIRRFNCNDHPGDPTSHFESFSAGSANPADQPDPQTLSKHDPPGPAGEVAG
jgi:ParB family chromosome partitioning protein